MDHTLRFSTQNPFHQIKVNSSSLGTFKLCERLYYYTEILRLRRKGGNANLDFGTLAHQGLWTYHKLRAKNIPYERALVETLKTILPLAKGLDPHQPKNLQSLARLLVWYLDKYERSGRGPKILTLRGEPATEVSWELPTGLKTPAGEDITLFGTLDKLEVVGDSIIPRDLKTTLLSLGPKYAKKYSPDNQFTLYILATEALLGRRCDTLILDAAQIGQTFVRLEPYPISRNEGVLNEWLASLPYFLKLMQFCAERALQAPDSQSREAAYPQRDKSCDLYGGCSFRDICARSPKARQQILDLGYERREG